MGLGKLIRGLTFHSFDSNSSSKASSSKPSSSRTKSATLPLPPLPAAIITPPAPPPKPAAPTNASDNAPYSDARARSLFNTYSDPDLAPADAAVGAEGLEKLCADAAIDMGGVQPLLLAWQFNSKVMGQISKDEWLAGTSKLRIDTPVRFAALLGDLDEIVMTSKPVKAYKPKPSEVYNRDPFNGYVNDRNAAFSSFYNYCFNLAKGDGRNVELETACALWSVLLPSKFALAQPFIDWIGERKGVKGVNKDLWSMLLEFLQSVDPSLSNFDNDGAWPTAIDDFVEWKKSQKA